MTDDEKPKKGLSPLQLIQSVLAAFIGIQSEKKREDDFENITPKQVLLAGIILVIFFFSTVILITRSILAAYT